VEKILVVEDEFDIRELLEIFLEAEGYQVTSAMDGAEACQLVCANEFDLILLDLMLPKMDGFSVCEFIRHQSDVPIVMLTALEGEQQQLRGFDLAVDDYVTKPFSPLILMRRISAILKRTRKTENTCERLTYKNLVLDCGEHIVYMDGNPVELTQKEFRILYELLRHLGMIMTRCMLVSRLWQDNFEVDEQIINTHIKNIRKKLGVNYITTVRGVGYRIDRDI